MTNSNSKTSIAVASIGAMGVIGAALFANWDKVFTPSSVPQGAKTDAQALEQKQVPLDNITEETEKASGQPNIQQVNEGTGSNLIAGGNINYNEAPVSVEEKQKRVILLLKRGMPYAKTREILMKNGWQPVLSQGTSGPPPNDETLLDIFNNRGFQEIESCSGFGLGYCLFTFHDGDGRTLKITTVDNSPGKVITTWSWDLS
jgi:hypothetical protein